MQPIGDCLDCIPVLHADLGIVQIWVVIDELCNCGAIFESMILNKGNQDRENPSREARTHHLVRDRTRLAVLEKILEERQSTEKSTESSNASTSTTILTDGALAGMHLKMTITDLAESVREIADFIEVYRYVGEKFLPAMLVLVLK